MVVTSFKPPPPEPASPPFEYLVASMPYMPAYLTPMHESVILRRRLRQARPEVTSEQEMTAYQVANEYVSASDTVEGLRRQAARPEVIAEAQADEVGARNLLTALLATMNI